MDLLEIMKALCDETRIRMLNILKTEELCVCELEHVLKINQSNASRHLNKLTSTKIVCSEKRALYTFYKINEKIYDEFPFIRYFIKSEIGKLEKCKTDTENLILYRNGDMSCDLLSKIRQNIKL